MNLYLNPGKHLYSSKCDCCLVSNEKHEVFTKTPSLVGFKRQTLLHSEGRSQISAYTPQCSMYCFKMSSFESLPTHTQVYTQILKLPLGLPSLESTYPTLSSHPGNPELHHLVLHEFSISPETLVIVLTREALEIWMSPRNVSLLSWVTSPQNSVLIILWYLQTAIFIFSPKVSNFFLLVLLRYITDTYCVRYIVWLISYTSWYDYYSIFSKHPSPHI